MNIQFRQVIYISSQYGIIYCVGMRTSPLKHPPNSIFGELNETKTILRRIGYGNKMDIWNHSG